MDVMRRTEMIIGALRETGRVSVSDLSQRTGVSEMTVRRDLAALEQQGLLRRVHGGAAAVSRAFEPAFDSRTQLHHQRKQRIGERAASLIAPGSTVLVDAGTTTLEVVRQLPNPAGLTVCPLSLQGIAALADRPGIRLLVPGGEVRPREGALCGDLTLGTLERLHFDTLLLSVGGVHPDRGLTDFDLADVAVKRMALAQSDRVVVVADSTKIGAVAFAKIGPVTSAHLLVTDSDADAELVATLTKAGVEVELA
jgi:DeoR/GlpR family transcriptional regulator of sugar metabolism